MHSSMPLFPALLSRASSTSVRTAGARSSSRPMTESRILYSADQESFPSVFLQAQVTAGSLAELTGQVVTARLFVQPQENGPVWFNEESAPIELRIVSIDEKLLTAEVAGGNLRNAQTGVDVPVTGKFSGVVPEQPAAAPQS